MRTKRSSKPKVARTTFAAYLRGRLVGVWIGLDGEADLYAGDDVPLPLRVAFTIGATSKRYAPVLTERQVERKVTDLLDLARQVEEVEVGDDPGSSPPPPPAVPVTVVVEETQKVKPTPWIGDPLLSSA